MCQLFLCIQKRNFSWIWQKMRNFPINPHCKICQLWQRHVYRHDVAKVSNFYNMGLWGKSLSFVRSSWNFVPCYIQEGHDGPGSLTWENMNQMLNVAICITKNWPSELFFTLQVTLEMIFCFLFSLIGTRTWSLMIFALKVQKIWPQLWFSKSIKGDN